MASDQQLAALLAVADPIKPTSAAAIKALRAMGKDSFVLSPDVTARLIAENVVGKQPSAQREMAAVQAAFNLWRQQSGRSLTEISKVLAFSVGA